MPFAVYGLKKSYGGVAVLKGVDLEVADGEIAGAFSNASPLEAVAEGLRRASRDMGPVNRKLGPRIKAAVAASTELQGRDALKSVGLAAAMTDG